MRWHRLKIGGELCKVGLDDGRLEVEGVDLDAELFASNLTGERLPLLVVAGLWLRERCRTERELRRLLRGYEILRLHQITTSHFSLRRGWLGELDNVVMWVLYGFPERRAWELAYIDWVDRLDYLDEVDMATLEGGRFSDLVARWLFGHPLPHLRETLATNRRLSDSVIRWAMSSCEPEVKVCLLQNRSLPIDLPITPIPGLR